MKLEDYVTTGDCAKELGCSIGALRKRINRGRIKTELVGRQHLIPKTELTKQKKNPPKRGRPKKGTGRQ